MWSLNPDKYTDGHVLMLYALFVDVAFELLKRGNLVDVCEGLIKMERSRLFESTVCVRGLKKCDSDV